MANLNSILLVIQVLLSISLIGLILIQHGKGADAGAAFGSGASATVFGSRGSGNFLSRMTTIVAILFFIVCLSLAYVSSHRADPANTRQSVTTQELETAPAPAGDFMQESDLPPAEIAPGSATDSDLPPAE